MFKNLLTFVWPVLSMAAVSSDAAALELATPTGPYVIGTATYHLVDSQRREIFSDDPSARRELMVQLWYPADPRSQAARAPYIADADVVLPALAHIQQLDSLLPTLQQSVSQATSHARESAPLADANRRYPVLLFLEGLTGFRQMNTFQLEQLASYGYVVAALDQPYAAAAVVYPDKPAPVTLSRERLIAEIDPLIDQSLAASDPPATLHGVPMPEGSVPYLAQDVRFVLDQLAELDRSDARGLLSQRLDLERVGVLGVSLGGIVASEACRVERRLRACLIMDAPMPSAVVEHGLEAPSMWITRDASTMRQEGWAEADIEQHQTTMHQTFERSRGERFFLEVQGMFHANLTDIPLWSPVFAELGLAGPIDPRRGHRIINAYSLAFFERALQHRRSPILSAPSCSYPEVTLSARH